ncbi:hypothetical protein WMY93_024502 [Mugilogobius chulae]|uniref:Uncharacterized protein n=1 Tax=Mugilogobius chulae TaxID=88201 RepID=A0AAW0NAT0_9GOBI
MLHHYQTSAAGVAPGQARMFSIDNIISQQPGQGADLNSQLALGGGDLGAMNPGCSVTPTDPSACFQTQNNNILSRNTNISYSYTTSASPPNLPTMTQSSFSPGAHRCTVPQTESHCLHYAPAALTTPSSC